MRVSGVGLTELGEVLFVDVEGYAIAEPGEKLPSGDRDRTRRGPEAEHRQRAGSTENE